MEKDCFNYSQRLSVLPMVTSLPDGRNVVVDHMTDDQMTMTWKMVEQDMIKGIGFSTDEYDNEAEFRKEACEGYGFVVREVDSEEHIASFYTIMSMFTRDGCAADSIVIVRESERGKKIGQFCTRLLIDFARRLGYVGVYFDIFTNNKVMLAIVRKIEEMNYVGRLPYSGKINETDIVGCDIFFIPFKKFTIVE